jgi:hypothetical protein
MNVLFFTAVGIYLDGYIIFIYKGLMYLKGFAQIRQSNLSTIPEKQNNLYDILNLYVISSVSFLFRNFMRY